MRPELRTFPGDDATFRMEVVRVVDGLHSAVADGEELDADDVIDALRRLYPNTRIRHSSRLGTLGVTQTWYVFRDGRVRPVDGRRERLYEALSDARSAVADSSRAIDTSILTIQDGRQRWLRARPGLRPPDRQQDSPRLPGEDPPR